MVDEALLGDDVALLAFVVASLALDSVGVHVLAVLPVESLLRFFDLELWALVVGEMFDSVGKNETDADDLCFGDTWLVGDEFNAGACLTIGEPKGWVALMD